MEKQKLIQKKYREMKRRKNKKSNQEVFWFAIALLVIMVFLYFFGFPTIGSEGKLIKIEKIE
ncbi:hypothetical protein [Bacillus sp. THAF10]|uniref:hypothetical protein n=1 Tax=Bacillus sp. THAF10 TaxID=2587848 RepID=UPI0012684548|nr:hypothetical protein [Bacillus sp. THAF10]